MLHVQFELMNEYMEKILPSASILSALPQLYSIRTSPTLHYAQCFYVSPVTGIPIYDNL
jgi:hypothetical protein